MPGKKKEKKLPQPHARTFEYVFKERETAASFLKKYLPEKIRNKLDFRTLKISNVKFVDKKLEDYFVPVILIKRNCTNRLPVYWKKEVRSCKR